VQWLLAIAISLVVFTFLANLILVMYTKGVIRAALDEGVRSGSRAAATVLKAEASCSTTVRSAINSGMADYISRNQVQLGPNSATEPCRFDSAKSRMQVTALYCPKLWLLPSSRTKTCNDPLSSFISIHLQASARVEYIGNVK
jgi:hypothetical protein